MSPDLKYLLFSVILTFAQVVDIDLIAAGIAALSPGTVEEDAAVGGAIRPEFSAQLEVAEGLPGNEPAALATIGHQRPILDAPVRVAHGVEVLDALATVHEGTPAGIPAGKRCTRAKEQGDRQRGDAFHERFSSKAMLGMLSNIARIRPSRHVIGASRN